MSRGWNRAPDGWWQRSLRGPRPPSEVWPRVQQFRQPGPPQPSTRGTGPDKVRSLEDTLAALGAEDVAVKTEVEAALERAREQKKPAQSNQQARWSPDAALEHARCKVKRFEEALKAMGDMQGHEVEFLQDALKRARQAAPGAPIGQPVVRVQKVHRAFRASFREDRCGTRSRDGTAQRGTQSFDPSRSPSRGVAARRAATHSCSGCLRRTGRIEGRSWLPRNGNETRHCLHQLASVKRCHAPQWFSLAPHLRFPIRSCPICHRGWTIVMRSCSRPSRLGTRSAPRGSRP